MSRVLTQASLAEFVKQPIGRYCFGDSHIAWAWGPTLSGGAVWGHPGIAEVEDVVRAHDWWRGEGHAPPVDVLLDLSRLEHVSGEAFAHYVRRVVPQVRSYVRFIRRQALVVPRGLPGAIVAGFYPMLATVAPRYRLFPDAAGACRWLGAEARRAHAEVDALAALLRATRGVLHRLRAALARDCTLSVDDTARAVGMSGRSLQRALAEFGTTYRAEVAAARLERAGRLLANGKEKVDEVARALGLGRAAHFSAWFGAATGMTPAAFRRRAMSGHDATAPARPVTGSTTTAPATTAARWRRTRARPAR